MHAHAHACVYLHTRICSVGGSGPRTNKHNNTTIAPACICILQLECTHSILFWSHPDFLYVRAYAYACECICVCVHMRVRVNATSLHMRLCFPDEVSMVAARRTAPSLALHYPARSFANQCTALSLAQLSEPMLIAHNLVRFR